MEKTGFIDIRITGTKGNLDQRTETGNLDRSDPLFVERVNYHTNYDETYLQTLRAKTKKSWLGSIEPDAWLRELRGNYGA